MSILISSHLRVLQAHAADAVVAWHPAIGSWKLPASNTAFTQSLVQVLVQTKFSPQTLALGRLAVLHCHDSRHMSWKGEANQG